MFKKRRPLALGEDDFPRNREKVPRRLLELAV
jgi:hypothetical protein